MIEYINELVSNLGFPIAMVVYFIWHEEKTITPLVDVINNNTTALKQLLTKVGQDELMEVEGDEK